MNITDILRSATSALAPAIAALALASPVQAASVSYFLDQSNALDDGTPYLQVTIADGLDGAIDFTVEVLGALSGSAGPNFGIQNFGFNIAPGGFAEAANVSSLPDDWRARDFKRLDGFGFFSVVVSGTGNARLDTLSFSITGVEGDTPFDYAILSSGNVSEGHQFFAAHVAGFVVEDCDWSDDDDMYKDLGPPEFVLQGKGIVPPPFANGDFPPGLGKDDDCDHGDCRYIKSAFFGGSTAVPLPASAWFFLTGLAGLAARARRRRG